MILHEELTGEALVEAVDAYHIKMVRAIWSHDHDGQTVVNLRTYLEGGELPEVLEAHRRALGEVPPDHKEK